MSPAPAAHMLITVQYRSPQIETNRDGHVTRIVRHMAVTLSHEH
jgi:hypothetical protein